MNSPSGRSGVASMGGASLLWVAERIVMARASSSRGVSSDDMWRKSWVKASTPSPRPDGASRSPRMRTSLKLSGRNMARSRAAVSSRLSCESIPSCILSCSAFERREMAMANAREHSSISALNESEEKKMADARTVAQSQASDLLSALKMMSCAPNANASCVWSTRLT
eukprot:scaffold38271_cov29-Tisochrysis_lutea.AAC.4